MTGKSRHRDSRNIAETRTIYNIGIASIHVWPLVVNGYGGVDEMDTLCSQLIDNQNRVGMH